ncbi:SH3 domain-containing protein [Streptomyces caniferus]|uniref:SH3 domain-containing protein n=1 Tax=Streptomyces caniferus TaxID=285557 RepID=UPI002E2997F5|nr:SH3 domain-containing protein [Streptomyces caniferus]
MIPRAMRHSVVAAVATVALVPAAAVAAVNPTPPPARHAAPTQHAPSAHHATPPYKLHASSRGRVVTHAARLNVRSGPGTGYRVLGSLRRGAAVSLAYKKHGTRISGNRHWYKLADRKGYVSARYVRTVNSVPER